MSKNNNIILGHKKTNTVYNNEQYLQNKKQIDCISKVLVEQADVPQKLIDWLIESVRENTKLECSVNSNTKI